MACEFKNSRLLASRVRVGSQVDSLNSKHIYIDESLADSADKGLDKESLTFYGRYF